MHLVRKRHWPELNICLPSIFVPEVAECFSEEFCCVFESLCVEQRKIAHWMKEKAFFHEGKLHIERAAQCSSDIGTSGCLWFWFFFQGGVGEGSEGFFDGFLGFFHIKRKHPALQRCVPAFRCLCSPPPLAEPSLSMSFPHPHVVVCSLALIPHNQSVTELAISSCPCVRQQHARLLSPRADTSILGL